MAEQDFGDTLGIQWQEAQDTRAQFGTGETSTWEENYVQFLKINTKNIIARKTFAGSIFTIGVHNLGSFHPYDTTARLNLGSFETGVEVSTGSLVLAGGSTTGSWISPILNYNFSENLVVDTGSITDVGSSTWRHLIFEHSGSLNVDIKSVDLTETYDSIAPATGSENFENELVLGSNIRIVLNLGSPTTFVGSLFQAFKPAVLGSGTISGPLITESRIKQTITDAFSDTGSLDMGVTTATYNQTGLTTIGSLDEDFSTNTNQGNATAYWDNSGTKLAMSSSSNHETFYNNYADVKNINVTGSSFVSVRVTGSETKYGSDIIKYFVSATGSAVWQEVANNVSEVFDTAGSEIFAKVLFVGNGAVNTFIKDLKIELQDCDSGELILSPTGSVAQSISLSDKFKLSNFDRIKFDATGSNFVGSVNFSVSSVNEDNFFIVDRGIEKLLDSIGSKVKWKAEYILTSGSAVLNDIELTYKSDDF